MGDSAAFAAVEATWWREQAQARALAQGDVSDFAAEVDFAKLRDRVDDNSGVPTSGSMNRIFASRFSFGQGLDPREICFGISAGIDVGPECRGRFVGQLQPYAVYVPDGPVPTGGFGLTLALHSLSANYNQYANSVYQSQLGERGRGTVVVTPNGRGPDGFYAGYAEADTFEVWADVARHHPIDPDWVAVTGYSMGGFGTYRLLARYPDLFTRGFSIVARPGSAADQLASLRHTPLMAWNAGGDELVQLPAAEEAHAGLVAAGIPHTYWLFPSADHLTLATNDEWAPGVEFLGESRVDRDPAHIAYVVDPSEDNTGARVVASRAYWLTELDVREDGAVGTVEAHSEAFGVGIAEAGEVEQGAGALAGGAWGPMPYAERALALAAAPAIEAADRLVLTVANLDRVVVNAARARLTCDAEVVVDSDGPVEVVLDGCPAEAAGDGEPETVEEDTGTAATPPPPAPSSSLPATGGSAVLPLLGLDLLGLATSLRRRTP
jgi:pimeloyl-ACP methyl ester carboxylesterase